MKHSLMLAATLVAALGPAAHAQGAPTLAPAERAIVRAVDAQRPEALALLERIVNINSGTMNFPGVRAVGDVLRREFDALGFQTRWVDGAPFGRAGHLIAEHPAPGPKILLIGHLDTVFEPGHPFQKFERTSDSTARGPGIIDMKGGDVIIVHALKALKTAGALAGLNVVVVMHGDEEKAGSPQALARADLRAAATGAAVALGFEDGDGNPATANIARRGATGWTLSVTGNPAHSSQVFSASVGYGAVYETARILDQWRQRLSGDPLLTFNPGLAIGGTAVTLDSTKTDGQASGKSNVVAKTMHVTGDIRAISPELLARAQRVMREVTSAPLAGTSSTLLFEDGYPPMAPTDGNKALLARYDEASRAVGAGAVTPVDPAKAGAADVSFVAPLVPQVIDGIGLAGADDHTDKETADLRWLAPLTKRAAVLLLRLSQTAGRPVP